MSNKSEKFDDAKNEVLVENNAQTIFDHLNDLEKDSKVYSKRWFWELLQNAKDSVGENGKVSVDVSLHGSLLTFSHSGNAFEKNDILHLIFHGSSKKNLEGKTGRFGTGFMATHLLSRKVVITGKLTDQTFFKFELNREAHKVEDQQRNLEESYRLFCNSNEPTNYSTDNYDTKFEYLLSDTGIAEEGIKQLQKILPFVMAFNPKIENINIWNNGNSIAIERGKVTESIRAGHTIFQQEIRNNGSINYITYSKTNDSHVAVLLEKTEKGKALVDLDETYPKLYFDFPLFGTENLGLPIVINSTKFDLKAERDGVYLGEDDKPTINENKRIICDSLSHLDLLINFVTSENIACSYNLFKLNAPFAYTWLDKGWLERLFKEKIAALLDTNCHYSNAQPLMLKNLVVPFSEHIILEPLYRLVTKLLKDASPEYSDVAQWISIAQSYSKLENKKIEEYSFIINERKICEEIMRLQSLATLGASLKKEESKVDTEAAIEWLNTFFGLLSKELIEFYSSHYAVIPNQKGQFVKREVNKPFIDEIGNEDIKLIIEEFGWDIKEDLIKPGISVKEGIFRSYNLENVLTTIGHFAEKISDEELLQQKKRKALITYIKWLINNKRNDLLKEAFVIIEKSVDGGEVKYGKRRLCQSNSDKLLAPFPIWSDKYSIYKDIVVKKFVLIDEYTTCLLSEHFSYLDEAEMIFISPLIIKSVATKNELKLLVKKAEDYPKLLNEKDEIINNIFEFSDIAYLTRSEDNILSKTGDSFKSAKALLKFLLSQVIANDSFFDQVQELNVGAESISLSKCLWLCRLRDTQWLPAKGADGEKQNNSERPSVANISDLIKDDSDIQSFIKTKHAAIFFNHLGISVADIIRNSISSEEQKLKWDMTISQLLTNGKVDPELAIEMLEDENLQKEYLDRRNRREKIKENQNIGYLFEAIFRKIFESEEYKSEGFAIRRTAIGSDFGIAFKKGSIIEDQDVLDENNSEILFKIGETLIELKATGKSVAEMTTTQAEEATKPNNNYVLAVLPLKHYDINEETVKEHTKFVVNIATSIEKRFKEYNTYRDSRWLATQDHEDVKLAIEDGNIRYQVKSAVWEAQDTLTFDSFIDWLKSKENNSVSQVIES